MEDYRAPGPAIIFIICRTVQNLCKLADRALRLPFCPIVCLSVILSLTSVFRNLLVYLFDCFLSVLATSCTDCMSFRILSVCFSIRLIVCLLVLLTKLPVCLSLQVIALAWAASLCDYLVSIPVSVTLSWLNNIHRTENKFFRHLVSAADSHFPGEDVLKCRHCLCSWIAVPGGPTHGHHHEQQVWYPHLCAGVQCRRILRRCPVP